LAPLGLAPVKSASSSHAWSRSAVELRSDELGLVELGGAEDDPRKIEPRQIEAGQLLAAEIGGRAGFRRRQRGFDLGPCHLRAGHLRRGKVEMAQHILGVGRPGKSQNTDCQHPMRSSDHQRRPRCGSRGLRLALSVNAAPGSRPVRLDRDSPAGGGACPRTLCWLMCIAPLGAPTR